MAGLIALLGSTFMLCFGRSEAVLIIARVLQGISAAVVWTVGMTSVI
jgi:MFS family permease